jgi:NodT family efflux transporter outer membrane factor (OMF) lipoprotein
MPFMTRLLPMTFALATLLAGCAGSPPLKLATAPPPAALSAVDPAIISGQMRFDWWTAFGSADLDHLVAEALAANFELAAADANLKAAAALAREARAQSLPQVGIATGAQRLREPAATQPPIFRTPGAFPNQTIASMGAELSWEIDIVGGRAKTARAAVADAQSALWQRRQLEAAIAAQVVRAWLDLGRSRQQAAMIDRRLDALDRLVAMARLRVIRGSGAAADVAMLEQAHAQAAAERPALDLAERNALRRLAVLTARDPIRFVAEGAAVKTLARTPATLTVQDPRALLRMRPDVQRAEQQLLAAFERAGASRAALYPSLSLGASAGLAATPADLSDAGAFRFAIGPSLNWGIFNLGRVKAGIAAADANSEAAAATWQQTLLAAVEETDGAVDGWLSARRSTEAARSARGAAEVLARAARSRNRAGLSSTFELAEAEAGYLAAEAAYTAAEAGERDAWATANLSLGAGWRSETPRTPSN